MAASAPGVRELDEGPFCRGRQGKYRLDQGIIASQLDSLGRVLHKRLRLVIDGTVSTPSGHGGLSWRLARE
jgi:hypothetical protein